MYLRGDGARSRSYPRLLSFILPPHQEGQCLCLIARAGTCWNLNASAPCPLAALVRPPHLSISSAACFIQFDAFAKIDGGGAGRDANDDKRVEHTEWMAGWKGVREHGFRALANVRSDAQAEAAFKAMDDNGGGVVLMDEWCAWLKDAEVKAGSLLGAILDADEDEAGNLKAFEIKEVPKVIKKPKKPTKQVGPKKKLQGAIKAVSAVNAFSMAGKKKGGLLGAAAAAAKGAGAGV